MKIIVNATPLLNIPTGIGRYIRSLYTEIHLRYPEIEIKYFDGTDICDAMPKPPESNGFWGPIVKVAWSLPSVVPYVARILIHEKRNRKFFKLSESFDIYHEAGYFPFKTAKKVKTIFTIHDLSLKTLPDFHPKERVRFFKRYFMKSLRRADSIITPSEFTKKEIKKEYPSIDVAINPIHLGFEKSLFFKHSKEAVNSLKTKLNLPGKYILFVGTSDPRKNIKSIIKALHHLPEAVKLVCAGWSGWYSIGGEYSLSVEMKHRVVFTGYLKDRELAALYSGARAFVYPSFYEGFGLPVLEAMACGCPVVCSNTSSLPEVVGTAALTCYPNDLNCVADSINKLFIDNDLYEQFQVKSIAQAEKFSWTKAAEKTVKVFSETV